MVIWNFEIQYVLYICLQKVHKEWTQCTVQQYYNYIQILATQIQISESIDAGQPVTPSSIETKK